MKRKVSILSIEDVTHDVKCLRFEKPPGYSFVPGQATDVALNKPGWEKEVRPFTITCLNENAYLEFTIKCYADHDGVTNRVRQLVPGDQLIIDDPWGAIEYKGPGYFIAGGAGITPFMAILRQLKKDNILAGNTLLFSNKTVADIIYKEELNSMLGRKAVFVLTKETHEGYLHRHIDEVFLKEQVKDFSKHFYLCGPDKMVSQLAELLKNFGADPETVVFEK